MPIDAVIASFITVNGSVEEARLRAFPFSRIEEPGIGCMFPDGSLLLVDGLHRLVNRVQYGLTRMRVMTCQPAIWQTCLADPAILLRLN